MTVTCLGSNAAPEVVEGDAEVGAVEAAAGAKKLGAPGVAMLSSVGGGGGERERRGERAKVERN